jgi:thioredoxin 1
MIPSIQNIDELKDAVSADDVVVVDLYATWCEPCQQMLPVVEELAEELSVPFYKVDIDQVPDAKTFTGAKAVPMLLVYKNGKRKEFAFGITPKDKLQGKIERAIK